MSMEGLHVRTTSLISAFGLAAAAALTLTSSDARAQSGVPAPPPPGFEGQAAPPQGYYVPASVAQSGPRRITDWEEGEPIPPGYHPITRIRKGLVIGGALTFGITYLITALSGAVVADVSAGNREAMRLVIPVAGPFTLLSTGTASGDMFLVFNGLVQAAGVGMLIGGLAAPKTVLVRNDLAFQIKPTPMTFGSNSAGFGFVGSF